MSWLENAVDLGFYNYVYLSEHDPILKNLRGEKRFVELMKYAKTQCDEFEVLEWKVKLDSNNEVMVFKDINKAID